MIFFIIDLIFISIFFLFLFIYDDAPLCSGRKWIVHHEHATDDIALIAGECTFNILLYGQWSIRG